MKPRREEVCDATYGDRGRVSGGKVGSKGNKRRRTEAEVT